MGERIILEVKTIAVVGLSRDPAKDSFRVASYLKENGYRIIPVNPGAENILGETSYPSLLSIPAPLARTIDLVDIFRPSAEVLPIVEQAIELKKQYGVLRAVWMQLGIADSGAAAAARAAGLDVIMNRCALVEREKLVRGRNEG